MPVVNRIDRQKRQKRHEANWQTYWRVPEIWPNGEVYILGGGPSLNNIDVSRLRGRHVIAVNNAYKLGDWIDVCYFGDWGWYKMHRDALLKFPGLKVTTRRECEHAPGIHLVRKRNSPNGISKNPLIICWNQSSGGCAINLATLLGARRIILFGFDMRAIDNEASGESINVVHNWHFDHKDSLDKKADRKKNTYQGFLKPFDVIARDLMRRNIECINATPGSALTHFPIVEPESVL